MCMYADSASSTKKKVPKSLLLGGGMRSACYWLPYLAYLPTLSYTALHCTVLHSIVYRVRKAEAPRRIHVAKEIPTYQYTRSCTCTHYIYIYTYMIHTRVCKRITLCLTLLYLPALHVPRREETASPIQKQVGRFPYSSLLPDEIYYATTLLYYYTCTIR